MKATSYSGLFAAVLLLFSNSGKADEDFSKSIQFRFGNHIDTHQQSLLLPNSRLVGLLYIMYTGETDQVSGLPIARHPRGISDTFDERCHITVVCYKGWEFRGVAGHAKFLFHKGVNGNDHPVWLVNRSQIPQPGGYSHFHWITQNASELRASDVSSACNKNMAGQLENQTPTAKNETCVGWFLSLRALRSFAFKHGGEVIAVHPGIDNATHLNLLSNYAKVEDITPTRGGSSGH